MFSFPNPLPRGPKAQRAQALVEFALVLPVMLLMMLGLIDLGRAFVFGVAVQEGTRQAARVAANAATDSTITDAVVLGRLIHGSSPALDNCQSTPPSCSAAGWTVSITVDNGGTPYSSIADARAAHALSGSKVTVNATASVALLPGVSTGMYGLTLPQIGVQGQSAMVIL